MKYCVEVESTPECSKLQKHLLRGYRGKVGTLKTAAGAHTSTGEETLHLLLKISFPGCVTTTAQNCAGPILKPNYRINREDWILTNKIRSMLEWVISSL